LYDGYVFFCSKESQQQCLSGKRYTCTDKQSRPAEPIKEGSVIFLYNVEDKSLLGPFTALTEGAGELDAGAWAEDIETKIPSEDIRVTWENLHLIRDAPKELPFLVDPQTCRLTTLQTQRVLDLLKKSELYLEAKEKESSA
jgi:hypothetical protein